MDEPRPAGEATPAEPDPDAVAALRARLPEELAHLPVTSAAEYRQEAWKAHYIRQGPTGSYHPQIGLRGFIAGVTGFFAIGGAWFGLTRSSSGDDVLENVLLIVFLAGVSVLSGWSKWRSNRKVDRLVERNAVLRDISQRIDQEVEAGRLPLKPPGWDGPVLAPL